MKKKSLLLEIKKIISSILNLLDNAIKYSGNSKSIKIKSSENKSSLKITLQSLLLMKDLEQRRRIYIESQKDFLELIILKIKIEGTGLGLAITKHILNQHKGELKITSKEGKGSEFTILLPLIS